MKRLGFYFNANNCIGCKSCESACTEWNGLEMAVNWRQVVTETLGKYPDLRQSNFSMACNNCQDAPCVKACPTEALRVDRDNGLVQLSKDKCIGCRYCEWACPYGAIQYSAKLKKVSKCTLCSDRIADNLAPACVTSCPTECLQFGDMDALGRAHPEAKPDYPGLEESAYANPNLLCEPLRPKKID